MPFTTTEYSRNAYPFVNIDIYAGEAVRPRYTIDAEENAHELLKSMITRRQFELYKNDNYVEVKGTYKRRYKVYKDRMILVSQKIKSRKRKIYSLCIEPRDIADICPTDVVIAKIKLIRANEKYLHSISNRFNESEITFSQGCWWGRAIITGQSVNNANITVEYVTQ